MSEKAEEVIPGLSKDVITNPYKDILEELDARQEYSTGDYKATYEASMMAHFIKSLGEDSFNDNITGTFDWVKKNKGNFDDFFFSFHKSMRQCDFFADIERRWTEDNRSEEEIEEQKKLAESLPKDRESSRIISKKLCIEQGLEKDFYRYNELRRKAREVETYSVGGHMDMLFWNFIQISDMPYKVLRTVFSDEEPGPLFRRK